jgi:thioredoxin 1
MLHHADDSSFEQEILSHPGPVLVEFFTTTCGPCRQIEPHLRSLAQQLAGRVKVVKVDSDRAQGAARAYGVQMAPTFIMFVNGQPQDVIRGAPPANRLSAFAQSYT